ncbi:sugar transferase [Flavobacterium agricola]|uniref:Sugar transferase n=1 Tax=Flavobacterium agricola TaxID=2870839 RepID=A0ABY6LWF4_9FLAO|nr:sugar transferase [Flavobacterium agricola]UYW00496.1 sugar transferase [Flavobacterium agricola]
MKKSTNIHFEISERKILLRFLDVSIILLFIYLTSHFVDVSYFKNIFAAPISILVLVFYILFCCTLFEMYNLQVAANQPRILKEVVVSSITIVVLYISTPIITPVLPNKRIEILLFFSIVFLSLTAWRLFYLKFLTAVRFQKNVIFVGHSQRLLELATELEKADPHYKVKGFLITDNEPITDASEIQQLNINEVKNFVNTNHIVEVVIIDKEKVAIDPIFITTLLEALESGIVVREFDEVYETATYRLPILDSDQKFFTYFPYGRSNSNRFYLFTVRFFDILFALIGLVILLCILPFVMLINLFANKGPLFYKQERVGQYGIPFKVFKLRSMVVDAEKNGAQFAQKNDRRITPFGRFIRKSRLDEVPQFINVLKGEMSVIGPRPERLVFVDQISELVPLYKTRHVIKPGLTGWAQVKFNYGSTINDSLIKLQYDLYYIKNRSLALDINIIIKTLNTVLLFKGQ